MSDVGKVFSLGTQLNPIVPQTRAEEFFVDDGVDIRHFSQGRTQESGYEAADDDQVIVVENGILCIKGAGNTGVVELISERGINIGAGYMFYIPAGQKVDFSTICGCVYTRIHMPVQGDVADELKQGKPIYLADAVKKSENKYMVANDHVHIRVQSLDRHTTSDQITTTGKTFLYALSGKGSISYNGDAFPIKGGRNFICNAGDIYQIASKGRFTFAEISAR